MGAFLRHACQCDRPARSANKGCKHIMGNSATRRGHRYECKSARKRNLRCDALDQHFESRGTGLHRLSLSKVWPRKKGRTRQTKSTTNCSLCWPNTAMVVNSAPASRRWRRQRPGQVCRNGLLAPAWNKMMHPPSAT